MNHCQGEPRSDGSVYRIAAGLHDLNSDLRGEFMYADHDRMLRMNRLV